MNQVGRVGQQSALTAANSKQPIPLNPQRAPSSQSDSISHLKPQDAAKENSSCCLNTCFKKAWDAISSPFVAAWNFVTTPFIEAHKWILGLIFPKSPIELLLDPEAAFAAFARKSKEDTTPVTFALRLINYVIDNPEKAIQQWMTFVHNLSENSENYEKLFKDQAKAEAFRASIQDVITAEIPDLALFLLDICLSNSTLWKTRKDHSFTPAEDRIELLESTFIEPILELVNYASISNEDSESESQDAAVDLKSILETIGRKIDKARKDSSFKKEFKENTADLVAKILRFIDSTDNCSRIFDTLLEEVGKREDSSE